MRTVLLCLAIAVCGLAHADSESCVAVATTTTLSFHDRGAVCVHRGSQVYGYPDAPFGYALALTQDRRLLDAEVVGEGGNQKIIVFAYRMDASGRMPPQSPVGADACYFPQKIALVPVPSVQTNITLFPWCESGYWCYKPYECEAWQLQQMRAEADKGVLHFGYPGVFLQLKDEPAAAFSPVKITGRECIAGFPGRPPHVGRLAHVRIKTDHPRLRKRRPRGRPYGIGFCQGRIQGWRMTWPEIACSRADSPNPQHGSTDLWYNLRHDLHPIR